MMTVEIPELAVADVVSEEAPEVREDRENLARIEASRASFQARLDELSRRTDKVRHAVDIRSRIRDHPFAALGAALGGGALVGLVTHERPMFRPRESAVAAGPPRGALEALAFGMLARVGQYLLTELTQHAIRIALEQRDAADAEDAEDAGDVVEDAER